MGVDCRGAEKGMGKKRSRMSPWRLTKKISEQAFGVGLGPALPQANCVTRLPVPENCNLCKANPVLLAAQERGRCQPPCLQCYSGKPCSPAKTSPSGRLREKGKHRCLHFTEGETETEDIGAASKFRADPPGFLTRRHFAWEHTIPHTLLGFFSAENEDLALQRLRDIFLSQK